MKNLLLYRILTYILLAIGGFVAMMVLGMLLMALANPVLLLAVFLLACVVIYTYGSWRFLNRAIDAHQYCKPSLRDLIKVNAYGTLAFAILSLLQSIAIMVNPQVLNQSMEEAIAMQPNATEGMEEMMLATAKVITRLLLVYSVLLITHIAITFRLLRQHADAFEIPHHDQ